MNPELLKWMAKNEMRIRQEHLSMWVSILSPRVFGTDEEVTDEDVVTAIIKTLERVQTWAAEKIAEVRTL